MNKVIDFEDHILRVAILLLFAVDDRFNPQIVDIRDMTFVYEHWSQR